MKSACDGSLHIVHTFSIFYLHVHWFFMFYFLWIWGHFLQCCKIMINEKNRLTSFLKSPWMYYMTFILPALLFSRDTLSWYSYLRVMVIFSSIILFRCSNYTWEWAVSHVARILKDVEWELDDLLWFYRIYRARINIPLRYDFFSHK